jgi:hypothetical protein
VAALYKFDEMGEGLLEPEAVRIRLPSKLQPTKKKVWSSGGKDCWAMPAKIRPLTTDDEKGLILQLISELRVKLALDLDPNPTFERGLGLQSRAKVRVNYLIIGSSHASKLRKALEEIGRSSTIVYMPNWRIGRGSIDGLKQLIQEAVRASDPETVLLQLLDNSCYYARGQAGSRHLARKGEDDIYHMEGDVQVCSRDVQYEHFEAIKPLLDIFDKKRTLIMSPLPRYFVNGYCSNRDHCANIREPGYKNRMLQGLEDVKKNLKDYLFHKGKRNIRVVDPTLVLKGMVDTEIWGLDPIHPKDEVYKKMAEDIVKVVADATESGKRGRSDSMNAEAGPSNRGRDPNYTRMEARGSGTPRGRGWRDWSPGYGRGWASEYRGTSYRSRGGYRGRSLGKKY